MALIENLQDIKAIKEEIKTSIENKGVDTTNSTFADYPELIDSIETGGGSEDWIMNNIDYLFMSTTSTTSFPNNRNNRELFDIFINHIKNPTSLYSTFLVSNNDDWWLTNEQFDKVLASNLSNVKNMYQAFYYNGAFIDGYKLIEIPNCTDMYRAFAGWMVRIRDHEETNIILDFNGTTGLVTNFSYAFMGNSSSNFAYNIKEILNLNMDKCSSVTGMFDNAPTLRRITFKGSFGGASTSSSLTLDLTETILDHDAILETFNSLSQNTNGRTRIIKLNSDLYSSLSEDELSIATGKGYTITSA